MEWMYECWFMLKKQEKNIKSGVKNVKKGTKSYKKSSRKWKWEGEDLYEERGFTNMRGATSQEKD